MGSKEDLRRLEQWMTYIRWFGVVLGVLGVALQPTWPDDNTRLTAIVLVTILLLGSVIVWGAAGRLDTGAALRRLGTYAFLFDFAIVTSLVWVFAFEDPYV